MHKAKHHTLQECVDELSVELSTRVMRGCVQLGWDALFGRGGQDK
jgi:hypothetical protein